MIPQDSSLPFPFRLKVDSVIQGRYPNARPTDWDDRQAGYDTVESSGKNFKLYSEGDQSVPEPGWVIMITGEKNSAYSWTLYGFNSSK